MKAINITDTAPGNRDFTRKISEKIGQPLQLCYQCGKCTAGCPVSFAMDYPPHRVIRALQLGLKEDVINCGSIWLCTTCETCSTRCPRGVNIAGVMEALRIEADRQGIRPQGKGSHVPLFYNLFLNTVHKYGRLFEFGTMFNYNIKTLNPFKDVDTAIAMLKHGKLGLKPSKVKSAGEIARIFDAVAKEEEGER
ncbi:MAG: 4Fe-4S dicluster domain-containing protein [Eubacteriales bacterium]